MHSASSTRDRCALESIGEPSNEWHALLASKLSGDHLPVQPLLQQLDDQAFTAGLLMQEMLPSFFMQARLAVSTRLEASGSWTCLAESQGEAAPAHGGLIPLVRPEPDLGQQRIAPDRAPSYPARSEVKRPIILHQQATVHAAHTTRAATSVQGCQVAMARAWSGHSQLVQMPLIRCLCTAADW